MSRDDTIAGWTTKEADMTADAVERVLRAARETVAKPRYCWAVTPSADGGANARGMQRLANIGDDEWTVWFLTDGSSRKAGEIRRSGHMTVAFAHDAGGDCVALVGPAVLVTDRSLIRAHWQEGWNRFFAGGRDDPNAVFVKVEIRRIEICVEHGTWTAALEREAQGPWRLLADSRTAVSAA
jgi:general stress protein 26